MSNLKQNITTLITHTLEHTKTNIDARHKQNQGNTEYEFVS